MLKGENNTSASNEALRKRVIARVHALLARTQERHPDWMPPPFDPYLVARTMEIPITDCDELGPWDALLIPVGRDGFRIVCNAKVRSEGRRRFSIAHEIAHTLLPDAEKTYHLRTKKGEHCYRTEKARQEERLCDLAAAEMLMPGPVFRESIANHGVRAASVPLLAQFYGVSREAAALRMIELSRGPLAVGFFRYGLRPSVEGKPEGSLKPVERRTAYRVQRAFRSPGFPYLFPRGKSVHHSSVIYRAAIENRELTGMEMFSLARCRCRLELSAVPLALRGSTSEPPLVCAVFNTAMATRCTEAETP